MKRISVSVLSFLLILLFIYPTCAAARSLKSSDFSIKNQLFTHIESSLDRVEQMEFSKEQVGKINKIKLDLDKELVKRKAEIDVIKLEIQSMIWQQKMDVKAINSLLDQKYKIKNALARFIVSSMKKFNDVLTEEQFLMLKNKKPSRRTR